MNKVSSELMKIAKELESLDRSSNSGRTLNELNLLSKNILGRGKNVSIRSDGSGGSYSSSGGYAGGVKIDSVVKKAKSLGFKKKNRTLNDNADGSQIGYGIYYESDFGDVLKTDVSYGNTSAQNYFYVSLKLVK